MSKRNFILLIIVLIIIVIGFLGFLFFRQAVPTQPSGPGTNFNSTFNPFGSGGTTGTGSTNPPPVNVSGYVPPPVQNAPNVKLRKVSTMPIAGYIAYNKERLKDIPPVATDTTTTTTATTTTTTKNTKTPAPLTEFAPSLRYVSRANGNIFETFADKINEVKFSTTIIPQIYEAFFGNKGESVVMRYLKPDGRTIESFVGTLPKEYLGTNVDGTAEVKGSFLPEGIRDMSLSADTANILYLFPLGDNTIGTTLNFGNNKKTQIFTSAFNEWLSQWPNNKMVTLTTKPASGVPGFMFAMDPANGSLNKIIGNVNGLTTLASPDGKLVLYGDDGLSLSVYHMDTQASNLLGVKTLPEKCVWGKLSDSVYCAVPKSIPGGIYPDSWYQGEASFTDQIWKVDIKTGNATMLIDPITVTGGEEVDGIKLALDDGENYLFFVNKKDSFLWELGLK